MAFVTKSGFIGLFGKPNSGKSTLLNSIMGEELAIVTPKAQTTWHRIPGIFTIGDIQMVFVDTPGIHAGKDEINRRMMAATEATLQMNDFNLFLVDASLKDPVAENVEALKLIKRSKCPVITLLTKSDLVKDKERLKVIKAKLDQEYQSEAFFKITSKDKETIKKLMQFLMEKLPNGPFFYPKDDMSDLPTRFFVQEFIRKQLFLNLSQELPYKMAVQVDKMQNEDNILKIFSTLIVASDSHKKMVIGDGGSMIKRIGSQARADIEKFLGDKIFLDLFVKVVPNWTENHYKLKELGLQKPSYYKNFRAGL